MASLQEGDTVETWAMVKHGYVELRFYINGRRISQSRFDDLYLRRRRLTLCSPPRLRNWHALPAESQQQLEKEALEWLVWKQDMGR